MATFNNPKGMAFRDDGRLFVTDASAGEAYVVTSAGQKTAVTGWPSSYPIQSLVDIAFPPSSASAGRFYYSYKLAFTGTAALGISMATLSPGACPSVSDHKLIWRSPNVSGGGEDGGRIAFDTAAHVFFSYGAAPRPFGDLQEGGYVLRFNPDGSTPADNPAADPIWATGVMSPWGLAFDTGGRLWDAEIDSRYSDGGVADEMNLIQRGADYKQSGGLAPAISWNPTIKPSGLIFYSGTLFAGWQGDAVIGSLKYKGLIRLRAAGATMVEIQRIPLGIPVRDVEQGPDGAIWVLEDGAAGRLIRLIPQ